MRTLPDPISEAIQQELSRFGPESGLGEIVEAWPAAVGPAIAANAWPARVARDGTLHVAASSSAWAFELTQLSSSVLARLRERLGESCPSALRFAVGPLPEAGPAPETSEKRTVPKPNAAHEAEAERIAAAIEDPALREAVAKAAAASLAAAGEPSADRFV
jgi:predicted nucleic acid-binding Zn ribbon protein